MTSVLTLLHDDATAVRTADVRRRGIRPSSEPVRLVLLDDQHLIRQALKSLLLHDPRYLLIGDTAVEEECVSMAARNAAQVVLVNGAMHAGGALAAVRALNQLPDPPRTIALGDNEDPDTILELFAAGAFGFLPKNASLVELREAIDAVAAGGTYVRASSACALASGLRVPRRARSATPAERLVEQLSDREKAVLVGIARGFSGREVADQLGITVKTVDTYRRRIGVKTGLHHRTDLVKTALAVGLLAG